MMRQLQGKTVIITGASRGIGEASAREFANAGSNVALLSRGEAAITKLADDIGDQAIAIPCDVSRFDEVEAAAQATRQAFGKVDVFINNAGVIDPVGHLADIDPDAWAKVIDVNLKGVFHGIRAIVPIMLDDGGGSVLTVTSGAAHSPVEAWSHYCASKAGAAMLTRCLDKEYGEAGIRAMSLSPGTVATQMQKEIKASGINPVSQLDWSVHIPVDWPARALVWMCTDAADDFVGQEISLRDDGIRARIGLSQGR